jgi:hypothetical protein
MIDALKSIAIVSLVMLNAILIVTGCNVIGTNAVANQMRAKELIVREQNAMFDEMVKPVESIVTASSLY